METGMGLRIAVAALAVWKVCQILAYEDGPWDLVIRLRKSLYRERDRLKNRERISGQVLLMISCVSCSSFWVSIPAAFWVTSIWQDRIVSWLCVAALATVIDHLDRRI
jgi:hypothetical protein